MKNKLAEESAKALKIILEITNSNVRKKLQNRINEVYEHFSRKGYKAILNNNFELKVVKEYDGRIVPMSDGEAQITSLCFIGALVDVAREKSEVLDTGGSPVENLLAYLYKQKNDSKDEYIDLALLLELDTET